MNGSGSRLGDDLQRHKALKKILLDRKASLAERDDAAIDLGDFDDPEALDALMEIAVDPQEEDIILASCGESIALIWQSHTSGMLLEYNENIIIYHCNDFGFETDFDRLVFSIEFIDDIDHPRDLTRM